MTFRIGWISPLTSASGVGTFSHAVTSVFPDAIEGEAIDLTILHPHHAELYKSDHRCLAIDNTPVFHQILALFDLLIYNIGNNREHHDLIFRLLRQHPGIIICHDYVYQHYLADQSAIIGQNFLSYAALLTKYGGKSASSYLKRSRITSRTGHIRYSPWDSEYSALQPMSEAIVALGSALVVHSEFAHRNVATAFAGPILKLGMPHDQKMAAVRGEIELWERSLSSKSTLHLVSFGHIQGTKCIDLVIEAIAASKGLRRRLRYTVAGFVGDQTYYAQLRSLVVSTGLHNVVTFEAGVSDARLADLMRDADLFINLRKPNTEGSSASLIEQLEAARPVVVLDSGCYAEIEASAAIKLPVDATAVDLKNVLERFVSKPELLPPIARAGQAYARSWSCRSYGQHLVAFIGHHRDLLTQRSHAVAIRASAARVAVDADASWLKALADARASLRYFDSNMLALDPDIILRQSSEELSVYVAHVLFGVFDRPGLQPALFDFFAVRTGQAAYWACVKFALIADAVFQGNAAARERLAVIAPCYDLDFWAIIQTLSPPHYCSAATLLLGQHSPDGDDGLLIDAGGYNPMFSRSRLIEILEELPTDPALETLKLWLEQSVPPRGDVDGPLIDRDMAFVVGSIEFRHTISLSGFHGMEADHAWMRGRRGFLGLRLGRDVVSVSVLVRQLHSGAKDPCTVRLASGASTTILDLNDHEPHWITLEISGESWSADPITWIQISTSHAMPPRQSDDTRVLGACILRLHVAVTIVPVPGSPDQARETLAA